MYCRRGTVEEKNERIFAHVGENTYLRSHKPKRRMKIAVYCSANEHIDPDFFTITADLGRRLAERGHDIVFGGCNMGLMECVARAAKDAGGRTIGVVPRIIEKNGRVSDYVDVVIPCDNLSDRKELMLAQSDMAIVLPGGIGTLDELFSMAASHTIGYHEKPIVVLNAKGFWNSLFLMLDDLQQRGVVRGDYHRYIQKAENVGEMMKIVDFIGR